MKDPFEWWRNALAGVAQPAHEIEPHPGFYRRRVRRARPWLPASIFIAEGGELRCEIDGRLKPVEEQWPWLLGNPISREEYDFRVEHGRWRSDIPPAEAPPGIGHNLPPEDAMPERPVEEAAAPVRDEEVAPLLDRLEELKVAARRSYAEIKPGVPQFIADRGENVRQQLEGVSKQIDGIRKARGEPHREAIRQVDNTFRPWVQAPLDIAAALRPRLDAWLKAERDRIWKERQEENQRIAEARRIAEEQRRAALPPEKALPAEVIVHPEPVAPPKVSLGGGNTGMRRKSLRIRVTAKVTDQDALYAFIRNADEVREVLQKVADRLIRVGPVPGCERVEMEAL